jgi:hypothetical protein
MEILRSIKANNTISGVVTPIGSVTPDFLGQVYIDTVTSFFYFAVGVTDMDWVTIGTPTDVSIYLQLTFVDL